MPPLLALLVGCGPGASSKSPAPEVTFSEITATVSEQIPTVVTVTFSTDSAQAGFVRFGPEGEDGWTATAIDQGGGAWKANLVGLPPETTGWFVVGAGDAEATPVEVTTGTAPDWVLGLDTAEGDPTPGFLVTGLMGGQESGAVVLNTAGEPVWWWQKPSELEGSLHTRARLSADGQELWFNAFSLLVSGEAGDGTAALVGVAIDGSSQQIVSVPYQHHDFVVHDDGTLAWIQADERDVDGAPIRGDDLVEQAADGTQTTLWSSWDSFTYTPDLSPSDPAGYWTLSNHLDFSADDDSYTLGMRNINTIVQIDGARGSLNWILGEDGTLVPDDAFHGQHGFQVLDDGLLLFDNGTPEAASSRLLRFAFDPSAGTATKIWSHVPDPAMYSFVLGDAVLLDNGHVIGDYSTRGAMIEVDASSAEVARFAYAPGTVFGFAEYWPSLVR